MNRACAELAKAELRLKHSERGLRGAIVPLMIEAPVVYRFSPNTGKDVFGPSCGLSPS